MTFNDRARLLPYHEAVMGDVGRNSFRSETFVYSDAGRALRRMIRLRNGDLSCTSTPLSCRPEQGADLSAIWDQSFLRSVRWPKLQAIRSPVRVVDFFSGCGLMSLGVWEACRALGRPATLVAACDVDQTARQTYSVNFPQTDLLREPLEELFDGRKGRPPTPSERALLATLKGIDLLIGGPPCQGHSNLNNHTRGDDPKNQLYERMARFAELVRPRHAIIENVPQVLHDRHNVVERTKEWLASLGYAVSDGIVDTALLGVPQARRRHVLVASLQQRLDVKQVVASHWRPPRGVGWAIADLMEIQPSRVFDRPSDPSSINRRRIKYLFRKDVDDLPDEMRPDCHRLKHHSYRSAYGRMLWNEPSQTITSGFFSMGQGRFVHPKIPRMITAHEAARLQFIPDFFSFGESVNRTGLAVLIGNAVPAKLTYVFALELLR